MKYIISTGELVSITKDSKVKLVPEYEAKFPGYLEVKKVLETYLEVIIDKNKTELFSPEYIAEVAGGKEIIDEDLRPIVRQLLEEMLPNLITQAVKDSIKDKLTQQFFDQVAATTVKATVKTEVAAALKVGANAIK